MHIVKSLMLMLNNHHRISKLKLRKNWGFGPLHYSLQLSSYLESTTVTCWRRLIWNQMCLKCHLKRGTLKHCRIKNILKTTSTGQKSHFQPTGCVLDTLSSVVLFFSAFQTLSLGFMNTNNQDFISNSVFSQHRKISLIDKSVHTRFRSEPDFY